MATPRGRGLRPGGIVRALLRLVLLVAVGFAVGLVFGLVTEEPELLAGHLRGESEDVALPEAPAESAAAPGQDARQASQDGYASAATGVRPMVVPAERDETASLPRVAASAPVPEPAPSVAPAEIEIVPQNVQAVPARDLRVAAVASVPEPARRVVKAEKPPRPWSIQVGAFSEKRAARKLAETLSDGYPVEVLPATREGGRWRVRVQPIPSEDRARETAERLKREEGLPTWVTPMDDGRGRAEGRAG